MISLCPEPKIRLRLGRRTPEAAMKLTEFATRTGGPPRLGAHRETHEEAQQFSESGAGIVLKRWQQVAQFVSGRASALRLRRESRPRARAALPWRPRDQVRPRCQSPLAPKAHHRASSGPALRRPRLCPIRSHTAQLRITPPPAMISSFLDPSMSFHTLCTIAKRMEFQ